MDRYNHKILIPTINYGGVERWAITLAKLLDLELLVFNKPKCNIDYKVTIYNKKMHIENLLTWSIPKYIIELLCKNGTNIVYVNHNEISKNAPERNNLLNTKDYYANIVSISKNCYIDLLNHGIKSTLIENGIDFSRIRDVSFNEQTLNRKNAGLPDKPIIGFIGRFATQKNPYLFIDIVSQCKYNHGVMIANFGDLYQQTIEKIQNTNNITHIMPSADISMIFSLCDYILITSDYEGLSLVMLEAFYARKPVIIKYSSSYKSFCGDFGEFAHSFDYWDEAVNIIERMNIDDIYRNKYIEKAFDVVNKKFSAERMVKEYKCLLNI